jgi:hypothetical protein
MAQEVPQRPRLIGQSSSRNPMVLVSHGCGSAIRRRKRSAFAQPIRPDRHLPDPALRANEPPMPGHMEHNHVVRQPQLIEGEIIPVGAYDAGRAVNAQRRDPMRAIMRDVRLRRRAGNRHRLLPCFAASNRDILIVLDRRAEDCGDRDGWVGPSSTVMSASEPSTADPGWIAVTSRCSVQYIPLSGSAEAMVDSTSRNYGPAGAGLPLRP